MLSFDSIVEKCKEKCRYGDLWRDFTLEELEWYSLIKIKRGKILIERGQEESGVDDLMDGINIAIMSIQKLDSLKEKEVKDNGKSKS